MGTHISRVKSVDLDSWTDEQLQSVLKWGNSRANKYWEAKLAPGHVPSEAKIENFIRTKYDSKRWVMDGGIPDPATLLSEGDDDVPLNLVKEKASITQTTGLPQTATQPPSGPSSIRRAPQPDLFGDDEPTPRSSSAAPTTSQPDPPRSTVTQKQTKPADSLLGLDFFGSAAPPPNRPASVGPTAGAQSRPDLKQSILSLYASAPKQTAPQAQQAPSSGGSFGGLQSPSATQTSFGGMNDQFGGLSFGSSTSPPPQPQAQPARKVSAFSGLDNMTTSRKASQPVQQAPNYSGGSFFDTKTPKAAPAPPQASGTFSAAGFGDFSSAPSASKPAAGNGLGDLFDFGASAASTTQPPQQTIASPPPQVSAFNLTKPAQVAPPKPTPVAPSAWGNDNAWASNDAWNTPDTQPSIASPATKAPPMQASSNDFGWGSSSSSVANQSIVPGGSGGFSMSGTNPLAVPAKPVVAADDDFGGWSSAAPVTPAAGNVSTPGGKPASGFGGSEDLFSNAWA